MELERLEHLQGKIAVEAERLYGRFRSKESRLNEINFTLECINLSLNNKISYSSFVDIWKDRQEMSDSVKWVKSIRKSEWPN